MLTCSKISVTYKAGKTELQPLRAVDATFTAESAAIVGPSGSGKSTLMRVLSGLQSPSVGSVALHGREVRGPARGVVDERVAVIYQDFRLVDFLTVRENIELGLSLRSVPKKRWAVSDALAAVGLDASGDRWPATLSGGEQQRVAIARALALDAETILADEPTGSLDEENSRNVAALLNECAGRGVVVVVATHDPVVAGLMSRRLRLADGRLHSESNP